MQQGKAESDRLHDQLKQSEAALMDLHSSYEEQRLLKATVNKLKRQMREELTRSCMFVVHRE